MFPFYAKIGMIHEVFPPVSLKAKAPRLDFRLPLLVGLGLFALLLPTLPGILSDADMLWHLRTGQDILATGHFPWRDAYSWTMQGQEWIAKEWLSQVLFALAFRLAGWTGVALLALTAACTAYALVFAALERRAGWPLALGAVWLIGLAGNFHLLARPHVLAWPVAVWFAIGLLEAAEAGRAPRWIFALVMALWANLHGSFLLGFILTPFFAWESLWRTREPRVALAGRWTRFDLACLLAAMVHPYGWHVYAAAQKVLELGPALSLISEWRPQNFGGFGHFEFILLLGLGAALLSGIRLPPPRVALLLILLHSALAHVRQETLALMLIGLLLGAPRSLPWRLPPKTLRPAAFGVGLLLLLLMSGMAMQRGPLSLPVEIAPQQALAAARAAQAPGQVLNEDQFGGFLISQHVSTYADGRAELFGSTHFDLSMALAGCDEAGLQKILARPEIGWSFLPTASPANRALRQSPQWREIFCDEIACVFVRN